MPADNQVLREMLNTLIAVRCDLPNNHPAICLAHAALEYRASRDGMDKAIQEAHRNLFNAKAVK